jgi:hypothetical protein
VFQGLKIKVIFALIIPLHVTPVSTAEIAPEAISAADPVSEAAEGAVYGTGGTY